MSVIRGSDPIVLPAPGAPARWALLVLMLVGAVVVQSTLFSAFTIMGVVPQLAFVVAMTIAFLEGAERGAVAGFVTGLLIDLLSPGAILGLSSFVYSLLGYGVGRAAGHAVPGAVAAPVALVAIASVASETLYATASVLLGQRWIGVVETARIGALVVLYNTLLAPFVFPLVARGLRRLDRDKVIRL